MFAATPVQAVFVRNGCVFAMRIEDEPSMRCFLYFFSGTPVSAKCSQSSHLIAMQ